MMFDLFLALTGNLKCSVRRRSTNVSQLRFEPLENRRLLATFTVTNNSDGLVTAPGDSPGSLRQAIFDANALAGADTITFDASVFTGGNESLIRLTGGVLEITDSLTLDASASFGVTITGDANGDDITLAGSITDVSASFGGTAGATDDLLDDNSRVLNFSSVTGDLTLEGLTVTGGRTTESNTSYLGGGQGFEPTYSGGGIRSVSSGSLNLTDSTVSGNSTDGSGAGGGGISTDVGAVTLTNSTVSGNTTTGALAAGGGIVTRSGAVTLTNSTVSGNSTTANGGGVFAGSGDVTLTNSTVSGNRTTGTRAYGGGIFAGSGDVTLTNSTVSENTTADTSAPGGGISTFDGAVTLTNSTVSGNIAGSTGGGISTFNGAVTLTNSTISGNTAGGEGGGISFSTYSIGESLTVHNSIIAGNSDTGTAPDFAAPASNLLVQNSIIGNTTGTTLAAGNNNQLGVDFTTVLETEVVDGVTVPKLTDNGGSVQTIALLAGSPAIDAGDNTLAVDADNDPLLTDQRGPGFDRIVFGTVDIGAVEFSGTAPVVTAVVRDEGGVLARPDLISTYAVTFDQDVSVSQDDLFIFNETLGTSIDSSSVTLGYDSGSRTATWSFGSLALDPAFYTFELSSDISGVVGGLGLDGNGDGTSGDNRDEEVYVAIPGDANLDGQVDVLGDAAVLVNNLGTNSGAVWAGADFNADGAVDVLNDAAVLVNNLGQSVVPTMMSLSAFSVGLDPTTLTMNDVVESEVRQRLPSSSTPLALAGSQALDAAFESGNPIDDGLF